MFFKQIYIYIFFCESCSWVMGLVDSLASQVSSFFPPQWGHGLLFRPQWEASRQRGEEGERGRSLGLGGVPTMPGLKNMAPWALGPPSSSCHFPQQNQQGTGAGKGNFAGNSEHFLEGDGGLHSIFFSPPGPHFLALKSSTTEAKIKTVLQGPCKPTPVHTCKDKSFYVRES